jgi:3D-(3,5/4)-trihydroxycyclohexane-1,2-dione acylhydrolase (decyclizing)
VQNHGFASIGALSEQLGSQRFGTRYRYRSADGRLDGGLLPVDLAANAASLGVDVLTAHDGPSLEAALHKAKSSDRATVVHVETDPLVDAPASDSWWDVPVSEVSTLESTRAARAVYDGWKSRQRTHLTPAEPGADPS